MNELMNVTSFQSREERLATYEWLRRQPRLYETSLNGEPTVIATRFTDVDGLLKNSLALVQQEPGRVPAHIGTGPASMFYRLSLPHMDRPEHGVYRRIASAAFNPKTVAKMADWVTDLIESKLDALGEQDEIDAVRELAVPIPTEVACRLLHIPLQEGARILEPVHDLNAIMGQAQMTPETLAKADAAAQFYFDYFTHHVDTVEGLPDDDMLSIMIRAQRNGEWSKVAMATTLIGLFMASYHTTMTGIGNAIHALATHPAQKALLVADPHLNEVAWEELLRFDSPVHFVHRYPSAPIRVGETDITPGTRILLGLAAANGDPAQFQHPERYDLNRGMTRHLAFAVGAHFCLGAQLSRLEGKVLLQGLVARFPSLCLADAPIHRVHDLAFPHITSMRINLSGRSGPH